MSTTPWENTKPSLLHIDLVWPKEYYNLSQTMLRVILGRVSIFLLPLSSGGTSADPPVLVACCLLLRFRLLTSRWQNQKATQCHVALKSGRMDLQAWNFTPSTWGWLCWHRRTSLNGSSHCNVTSKTVWDSHVQGCFASGFQQWPWRVDFVASMWPAFFPKKIYILVSIWIQNGNCKGYQEPCNVGR